MNLLDLFATPQTVEIRLLSEYPPSVDPSQFKQVLWPNYKPITARLAMDLVPDQGGLIYAEIQFTVTTGLYLVTSYAVMQAATCLWVGQLDPTIVNQITPGLNTLIVRTIFFIPKFA